MSPAAAAGIVSITDGNWLDRPHQPGPLLLARKSGIFGVWDTPKSAGRSFAVATLS